MRILGSLLLVALFTTTSFATGDKLPLGTPAAVQAHDTITITTQTTFSRRVGKKVQQGTRAETSTVEALAVKGARISRAKVTRSKVVTAGALATVAWTVDKSFDAEAHTYGVDFGKRSRAALVAEGADDIVFDAGDGVVAWPNVSTMTAAIQQQGWLTGGVPLRAALAGKTFVPGTTVNLGGQEIEIVYQGLSPSSWSSLPGGSIVYQTVDAGVATFALTTPVELVLADGTAVTGDLAGTMTVDVATAMVKAIALEGDLTTADGKQTFHLVQNQNIDM